LNRAYQCAKHMELISAVNDPPFVAFHIWSFCGAERARVLL
jgi:hypothetical protein